MVLNVNNVLTTLRGIIGKVNAAADLSDALKVMVEAVRLSIGTEAASIFLLDEKQSQYVLVATQGLNPAMVGQLYLGLNEGLVGLIGRREEPINLENAPLHPAYFHHLEIGEENYRAFLGVPIIDHRRLLGVLTVQQQEARRFDEMEEAFLVTIAAQMAHVITQATTSGALTQLFSSFNHDALSVPTFEEAILVGIGSSPGIGIGKAVVIYPPANFESVFEEKPSDMSLELEKFDRALERAREEIQALNLRFAGRLPKQERALFDVYLKILDKNALGKEVKVEIENGFSAEWALKKTVKKRVQQLATVEDEYIRERAIDLEDLGLRILVHLQTQQSEAIPYLPDTILVSEEITAAMLAEIPEGCLAGIVSLSGSINSHAAIFSRALKIPTVMAARGTTVHKINDRLLIVDGYCGQVYVDPSPSLLTEYRKYIAEEQELEASLATLRDLSTETLDGHRVSLWVNTGLAYDTGLALSVGAEGVGLFRTEIPFFKRDSFPMEEEQFVLYRQLLKAFAPRTVVMRTLDIGGDKILPYFPIKEINPFLGWRGLRITLDHPEIFLVQLRAMLRANHKLQNLQIMLPMVTTISEVDESLSLIRQAHQELLEEGLDIPMPPIGVMIEVPSAVYQAQVIAKRVDFLSVGSNDLTQYLLAVDRNNSRVANLYDSVHPAVLQALLQIVEGAHSEGKKVSICGEMASDPVAVILLVAMGFEILSMNAVSLPRIKWLIRNFTLASARKLLSEVLEMTTPTLIRFHLEKAIYEAGLGNLIHVRKA